MKRILPGVYDDEQGGMRINAGELLAANGYADTRANREQIVNATKGLIEAKYPTTRVIVTDDPIPDVNERGSER